MLEVFPDALELPLDAAQMLGGGLDQLQLGASRRELGHRLLEVGVRISHLFTPTSPRGMVSVAFFVSERKG